MMTYFTSTYLDGVPFRSVARPTDRKKCRLGRVITGHRKKCILLYRGISA